MADMNIVSGSFKLSTTANGANTLTIILATENKFVDKNIVLLFTTPAAESPSLVITDKNTAVTIGTATGGVYPLSNSLSGITSYSSPGWVGTTGLGSATDTEVKVGTIPLSTMAIGGVTLASGGTITPSVTATATITINPGYEDTRTIVINPMSAGSTAAATVTASKQTTVPTLSNTTSAQDGKVLVPIEPTASATDINKYFLAMTAEAPATSFGSEDISKTVNTIGYLGSTTQIVATSIATTGNSKLFYVPLPSAGINVNASQIAELPTAGASAAPLNGKTRLELTPQASGASGIGTYYIPIEITAPATTISSSNITKSVSANGYIDSSNLSAINVSAETTAATATYYIPVPTGIMSASNGGVTASGTPGGVVATAVNAVPAGYYIEVNGYGTVSISQNGWVPANATLTSNSATKYVSLNTAEATATGATVNVSEGYVPSTGISATVANGSISTGTTDKTSNGYTTNSTAIVPENGYLYINEGYFLNTQIALGTLLPDDENYENATSDLMLADFEAYDTTGTKIIGAIATYDGAYTIS